mmetsp:Transcript_27416/g.54781  ORF Transcript_27416/g.54781 Transcript_27416/m.54781 type:complete len:200 (-) Transcript_27416:1-600(-)
MAAGRVMAATMEVGLLKPAPAAATRPSTEDWVEVAGTARTHLRRSEAFIPTPDASAASSLRCAKKVNASLSSPPFIFASTLALSSTSPLFSPLAPTLVSAFFAASPTMKASASLSSGATTVGVDLNPRALDITLGVTEGRPDLYTREAVQRREKPGDTSTPTATDLGADMAGEGRRGVYFYVGGHYCGGVRDECSNLLG